MSALCNIGQEPLNLIIVLRQRPNILFIDNKVLCVFIHVLSDRLSFIQKQRATQVYSSRCSLFAVENLLKQTELYRYQLADKIVNL